MADRNYPGWRAAVRENLIQNPFLSGPWMATSWYAPSWHIWKKGGMSLKIVEARTETQSLDREVDTGTAFEERLFTENMTFEASVPLKDLWKGPQFDAPAGSSIWTHSSRTAFGEGLYHAEGFISLNGKITQHSRYVHTVTDADGETTIDVPYDFTIVYPANVEMSYASNPAMLNGLATFCRISAHQMLAPFYTSWWDNTLFFPNLPTDPDGNPSVPPLDLKEELYFTDTALAQLAGGSWNASMQLLSSSLSATVEAGTGHNFHSYNRSGNFQLTGGLP